MPYRNKSRRGRSRRRGRLGGSTPLLNVEMPNASPNVEMPNAAPEVMIPPVPAPQLIHEQGHHLPNPLNPPAQGALGLVFGPLPGVQLPGAQHGPPNPQGPIGGRKSHCRKSHRRKSHRRKSHRR